MAPATAKPPAPATPAVFTIYGFDGCGYFAAAQGLLKNLISTNSKNTKSAKIQLNIKSVPRAEWKATLDTVARVHKVTKATATKITNHTTSPLILKDKTYIGGHDSLQTFLQKRGGA